MYITGVTLILLVIWALEQDFKLVEMTLWETMEKTYYSSNLPMDKCVKQVIIAQACQALMHTSRGAVHSESAIS